MNLNYRVQIKILGLLTLFEGLFMLPCFLSSFYFKETGAAKSLLIIGLICTIIGVLITAFFKIDKLKVRLHEGYLIACIAWVFCSLIGALPFYFSGNEYSFISCIFESAAGFTTTGCSVLNLDFMSKGLLLWRAVCRWLGGMGILILIVSLFPMLGISGQAIATAEAPGPVLEKMGAKMSATGKYLYLIYLSFTFAEFILLLIGPMGSFDALLTTLCSVSTGGLTITADNAIQFASTYNRFVILIFTVLSSLNFVVYFMIIKKRWRDALHNVEVKGFAILTVGATLLIALCLWQTGTYSGLWQAIKDSLCQVVSFISTSGYYVCDYTRWPTFAIMILFSLLFIGGCSFSTSGSLKIIRFITFIKLIKRGMFKQIHPNSVKAVIIQGKAVPADRVSAISTHILLYFGFFMFSCVVLSLNGFDLETTITTSIGIFSNTGVALGAPGCSTYFGMFNQFSQLFMSVMMIAGRLEMYAIIILFSRSMWNPDRAKTL